LILLMYAWHNIGDINIGFSMSGFNVVASHSGHEAAFMHNCSWDSDDSLCEWQAFLNLQTHFGPEISNNYTDFVPSVISDSIWQPPKYC
jgi:hypothetical protein